MRRTIFVSYHRSDTLEVSQLVNMAAPAFHNIRTVGVTPEDDFINSTNAEYIIRRIREKSLRGTSATVVAIGRCTWSRRFVDWEIAATLRANPNDPRGALLSVQLPSVGGRDDIHLPPRLLLNRDFDGRTDRGYASYHPPPHSGWQLAEWVEQAVTRSRVLAPAPGSTANLWSQSRTCT